MLIILPNEIQDETHWPSEGETAEIILHSAYTEHIKNEGPKMYFFCSEALEELFLFSNIFSSCKEHLKNHFPQ